MTRVLLIDNYDSFTYNLAQAFMDLGADVIVKRNDALSAADMETLSFTHLVVSPGPGAPKDAGISIAAIRQSAGRAPILGVCLGHQAIVEAYGGRIVRAMRPMHGKSSLIRHDGQGLFAGLPNPFRAGRYHSLIASRQYLPEMFEGSAHAEDALMAVRARHHAIDGVQFHPESVLTPEGG